MLTELRQYAARCATPPFRFSAGVLQEAFRVICKAEYLLKLPVSPPSAVGPLTASPHSTSAIQWPSSNGTVMH